MTQTTETTETTDTETTETTETDTTETETTETETTETETSPPVEGDPVAGKDVFLGASACGGCHTLADAGASGTVGPNLDESQPSAELVVDRVTNGQGGMPHTSPLSPAHNPAGRCGCEAAAFRDLARPESPARGLRSCAKTLPRLLA